MMPEERDGSAIETVRGSTFWVVVIAIFLLLFVVAGVLAMALAIWTIIGAF